MHEAYMQRAIQLANLGRGYVSPNPMVGAVIVWNNTIIGEGYHQKHGEPHAEVNAINSVKDKSLLPEATIYVTLEPCAHFGKTPPCANLIVEHKIPNVVIGCRDSYEEVDGKGITILEQNGIHVVLGILEKECLNLNRRFFTYHNKNRPYIILKWAQDKNGHIDKLRTNNEKGNFWITAEETKSITHRWRHEEDAILVGKNTVANDNPSLTCRNYKGLNPTRVVIDQHLRLDYGAFTIGDRTVPTIILTEKNITSSGNLKYIKPHSFEVHDLMAVLFHEKIQSVLIEGGKKTLERFIAAKCWDEARILEGSNSIKKGVKAPQLNGYLLREERVGKDRIKYLLRD